MDETRGQRVRWSCDTRRRIIDVTLGSLSVVMVVWPVG
jgi:hypothetical protein